MIHRPTLAAAAFALATPVLVLAADAADATPPEEMVFDVPSKIIPAIFTLIVFSVVLAILAKYAWGPIAKGLEERENRIRRDIEEAERARLEAEAKQREYAAQLEGAEAKVRELLAAAQKDADALGQRMKMDAQTEAEGIRDKATRDIEAARVNAVGDVRREAAELATLVAEKILRREIGPGDRKALLDESLKQIDRLGDKQHAAANGTA
jgi:F-type H+-transporting ATPase subunit b